MDRINELPDALLLQILSFVPTKDRVGTSVLSKQWETLWMLVPKLEYHLKCGGDSQFVGRSLLLHRAPVLESLCLEIDTSQISPLDIWNWVRTAVNQGIRELKIQYPADEDPMRLPKRFYTCQTLVVLKLKNYSDEESLETLLSSCVSLKDLVVECRRNVNVFIFTIKVPPLQSLSLKRTLKYIRKNCYGFVINTPSLKYLNIIDSPDSFCFVEDMPELLEANVKGFYDDIDKLFGSLTSAKRLSICSTNYNALYYIAISFHQLVHLELCTCKAEWWNLLVYLLKFSPKLRVLKLTQNHKDWNKGQYWNEPSSIPECLLTSLEVFEWRQYKGTKDHRELVIYIMRYSPHLKMAKIEPESNLPEEQLEIIKKLALSPRASTTCELVFD